MNNILHVSLAHGGGIVTSINSFIENSPIDTNHYLLAILPTPGIEKNIDTSKFTRTKIIKNIFHTPSAMIKLVRIHKISCIHLHSSFAGALGRLTPTGIRKIYTPHCYSFEREDISRISKLLYFGLEKILRHINTPVAACGPRERELALKLGYSAGEIFETYNYSPAINLAVPPLPSPNIVMVGRLCPQKDPIFFADTARIVKQKDKNIMFTWCGDGDQAYKNQLSKAGVVVTGWLDRRELLKKLAASSIYFHTARWEGNPMSLLEAAALKMPIISRDISSISALGVSATAATAEESAKLILSFLRGKTALPSIQHLKVNALCSQQRLQLNLAKAYKCAC